MSETPISDKCPECGLRFGYHSGDCSLAMNEGLPTYEQLVSDVRTLCRIMLAECTLTETSRVLTNRQNYLRGVDKTHVQRRQG